MATKKSLVYFSNGMDFVESTCAIALLLRMKSIKKTQKKTLGATTYKSNFFCHTEQAVFPIQKPISPCPKQCVMVNHQQQIRYQT
jgi:hypothetical protein